jgi:hypothetical protein
MSDAKPLATLTPTLLARKGGAKPAMRPQLQPLHEFHEAAAREMEDDLGWNDMGSEFSEEDEGAEVVSITAERPRGKKSSVVPLVVQQQAKLSRKVVADLRRSVLPKGRRAAFTLRLDSDRHLKLRLASAVLGRSAQDIVTEALDMHIAALADIEALASTIRESR